MRKIAIAGAFSYALSSPCSAQDLPAPAHTIVVESKINKGDLRYHELYRMYLRLLSWMPPSPRIIEPVQQMSFTALPIEEEDNFLKPSWNVAIVGTGTDIDLPMLRGGYFVLPDYRDKVARDANVMFNSQTKKNFLRVAWTLPLRPNQALGFADMRQALDEVRVLQKNIPWYSIGFRPEKYAKFDAIKACFTEDNGELRLDGKLLETIHSARCRVYTLDPELIATTREISFSPAPEIVVLEDSARYRVTHAGG